jgi:hypothetical protein
MIGRFALMAFLACAIVPALAAEQKAKTAAPSEQDDPIGRAVRALPELFDDPFMLSGSYTQYVGNVARTVPPRRVCDEAAETFSKMVPDAPRFEGFSAEEKQTSIDKMTRWWKENGAKLKWEEKRCLLVRPTKK